MRVLKKNTTLLCFRCPVRVTNPRLFNVLVNLKAYAKQANLGGSGSLIFMEILNVIHQLQENTT